MKRFVSIILAVALSVTSAFALAGCGSEPKTIEDYLSESPSAQQDIEESLSGVNNSDMDVAVTYEENKIIITCTLKSTYKKSVLKTMRKSYKRYMKKHLKEPMENALANIERETGITGIAIQVLIYNGNGKWVWSHTYARPDQTQTSTETQSTGSEADGQ